MGGLFCWFGCWQRGDCSALGLEPEDSEQGKAKYWERAPVEGGPAIAVEQAAREEGGSGNEACDEKIVGGLGLGFFFGVVSLGEQGGGADVHEVPANAEQGKGNQEVEEAGASEVNSGAEKIEDNASEDDGEDAKAGDQNASDEGGGKHAQDVPLDDGGGVMEGMGDSIHGKGSGSHQENHHSIANHAAQDGNQEDGVLGNAGERSPTFLTLLSRQGWDIYLGQQQQVEALEADDGKQRTSKRGGAEPIFGPAC